MCVHNTAVINYSTDYSKVRYTKLCVANLVALDAMAPSCKAEGQSVFGFIAQTSKTLRENLNIRTKHKPELHCLKSAEKRRKMQLLHLF